MSSSYACTVRQARPGPWPRLPLTSHYQLALVLHGCGLVPGYAGVVPVVHQGEVGNPQGAGEVDVVDGHPQARGDWPAVLLPGDRDGQVPGHHHARDEDPLSNGESRELKRLDKGWD